jgi:catechol 2,3-dioxygenase-like lactoylglutathione lyase family enzyme
MLRLYTFSPVREFRDLRRRASDHHRHGRRGVRSGNMKNTMPAGKLLLNLTIVSIFPGAVFGQGHCRDGYEIKGCPLKMEVATAPIKPVFAPTGWKTVALDHITFHVADYSKEAAFYVALMGWKLRSDDGRRAILDIGDWGSAIFQSDPAESTAIVTNYCFAIAPWNARVVEAELRKRDLNPVADNDNRGFESFHIKDPDGWDLQISNGNGFAKTRKTAADVAARPSATFRPTGWKTVWLDHFSYNASDYKKSVSFYMNLLGWKGTYDEGSQEELMMGQVGDIIIRGGNRNDPDFATETPKTRRPRIDHISFGISPWDSDGVKSQLERRGLTAREDTSTKDDIHVAAFKSYHTFTPNGFNLQISYVTQANRLALPNAVKPKGLPRQ